MSLETILSELPILRKVLVENKLLVKLSSMDLPNLKYDEQKQQLSASINNAHCDYIVDPTIDGVDVTKYLKQDVTEYNHQLGILRCRNIMESQFEEDRRAKEAMLNMAHMAGGMVNREIMIGGRLKLGETDAATKSILGSLVYRTACPDDRSAPTKEEQSLLLDNVDFHTYYIKSPLWNDTDVNMLLDRTKTIVSRYGLEGVQYTARRLADIGYDNLSSDVSDILMALIDVANKTR